MFLAALAITGSVRTAAARVGMSGETAYRLRRRPGAESFAAAWHAALGAPRKRTRKVTSDALAELAYRGRLKPLIHRRRHVATLAKPDNSALLRLFARLDRAASDDRCGGGAPESFASASASTSVHPQAEGRLTKETRSRDRLTGKPPGRRV